MKRIALFLTLLAPGCATTVLPVRASPSAGFNPVAGFNQVATLDAVAVRPVRLIEDSRCPAQVQCIWAGRLRIEAVIGVRGGSQELRREMTLGQPITLPEGALTLSGAIPETAAGQAIPPGAYVFTFTLQR